MTAVRYFIYLSYDGTLYHGWQIQPNGLSVQEVLQRNLALLLRAPEMDIVGAGRTDAGVHARLMVAHFDWPEPFDAPQLVYKLNKLLPPDVVVHRIEPVASDMHARFSATSRTYHYFLHLAKDPFRRSYSWKCFANLNFQRMNEAAATLLEYTDFTSFSKISEDVKTNLCTVTEAHWDETEPGCWRFTITANRFLRNMVRAIVGTLVDVGRGRMSVADFRRVIELQDRSLASSSAPACGLFLVDVRYDKEALACG